MGDLLPCPICEDGGKPYIQEYANGRTPPEKSWMVLCRSCRQCTGRLRDTVDLAVADWTKWPRWRRPFAGIKSNQERERLDRRIRNQRVTLRWWEDLFDAHVHSHWRKAHLRYFEVVRRDRESMYRKGYERGLADGRAENPTPASKLGGA